MPVAPAPVHVPPAAAPPAAPGGGGAGPQVGTLTMLRPDGTPGDVYPLRAGENNIGRATPADVFARDPHLSPLHATFVVDGGSVRVIDRESLNGVYYRISEPTQLGNGDFVRVGQELLRFEFTNESEPVVADDGTGTVAAGTARRGAWGRLERISAPAEASFSFVLRNPEHVIGRERGDILFRDDGYVSGMHARVYAQDGRVFLEDMGSSNGTFVRIRGERTLPSGGLILMGQQPFRIQLG
jgi:pSer/pThr/pTyr-binding forkhead associated (FHA) protein